MDMSPPLKVLCYSYIALFIVALAALLTYMYVYYKYSKLTVGRYYVSHIWFASCVAIVLVPTKVLVFADNEEFDMLHCSTYMFMHDFTYLLSTWCFAFLCIERISHECRGSDQETSSNTTISRSIVLVVWTAAVTYTTHVVMQYSLNYNVPDSACSLILDRSAEDLWSNMLYGVILPAFLVYAVLVIKSYALSNDVIEFILDELTLFVILSQLSSLPQIAFKTLYPVVSFKTLDYVKISLDVLYQLKVIYIPFCTFCLAYGDWMLFVKQTQKRIINAFTTYLLAGVKKLLGLLFLPMKLRDHPVHV